MSSSNAPNSNMAAIPKPKLSLIPLSMLQSTQNNTTQAPGQKMSKNARRKANLLKRLGENHPRMSGKLVIQGITYGPQGRTITNVTHTAAQTKKTSLERNIGVNTLMQLAINSVFPHQNSNQPQAKKETTVMTTCVAGQDSNYKDIPTRTKKTPEISTNTGSKATPSSTNAGSKATPSSTNAGSKATTPSSTNAGSKATPSSTNAGSKATPSSTNTGSKATPPSTNTGSKATPSSTNTGSKTTPPSTNTGSKATPPSTNTGSKATPSSTIGSNAIPKPTAAVAIPPVGKRPRQTNAEDTIITNNAKRVKPNPPQDCDQSISIKTEHSKNFNEASNDLQIAINTAIKSLKESTDTYPPQVANSEMKIETTSQQGMPRSQGVKTLAQGNAQPLVTIDLTSEPVPQLINSGSRPIWNRPYQRVRKSKAKNRTAFKPNANPIPAQINQFIIPSNASIPQLNPDLKVAVTTDPFEALNAEDVASIQEKIGQYLTEEVLKAKAGIVASFRGQPFLDKGVLKMWCEDDFALNWLRQTVDKIPSPRQNTRLIVQKQCEIIRRIKSRFFVPKVSLKEIDKVQSILMAQNPWYNISSWTLYEAEHCNHPTGVFLIVGIPTQDVDVLLTRNRRVSYMIGSVYVKFYNAALGNGYTTTPPNYGMPNSPATRSILPALS